MITYVSTLGSKLLLMSMCVTADLCHIMEPSNTFLTSPGLRTRGKWKSLRGKRGLFWYSVLLIHIFTEKKQTKKMSATAKKNVKIKLMLSYFLPFPSPRAFISQCHIMQDVLRLLLNSWSANKTCV